MRAGDAGSDAKHPNCSAPSTCHRLRPCAQSRYPYATSRRDGQRLTRQAAAPSHADTTAMVKARSQRMSDANLGSQQAGWYKTRGPPDADLLQARTSS
jgi:hypothetical protein